VEKKFSAGWMTGAKLFVMLKAPEKPSSQPETGRQRRSGLAAGKSNGGKND
jgi:hypothetical protein